MRRKMTVESLEILERQALIHATSKFGKEAVYTKEELKKIKARDSKIMRIKTHKEKLVNYKPLDMIYINTL